jgi:hypothetical protein
MTPIALAAGALVLTFGAALVGMAIRPALPDHHVGDASKDTVMRAVGLVVTLTAIVLGFMVGSAKGYYDDVRDKLNRIAADAIVLDSNLGRFGPDSREARELLRQSMGSAVRMLWPEHAMTMSAPAADRPLDGLERVQDVIRVLPAHDEAQRSLRARALESSAEMAKEGWLLLELAQTRIQAPLLAILVLWLVSIFLAFGLLAPRNGTVIIALLMSALAASGAIFLILEMYDPLGGLMQIPPATLEASLERIGR